MKIVNSIKSKAKQLGQGMTEYIIIVALIAIAAIGVFTAFGDTVREQVAGMATELGGEDSQAQIDAAQAGAAEAQGQADFDKGLGSYNQNGGQ